MDIKYYRKLKTILIMHLWLIFSGPLGVLISLVIPIRYFYNIIYVLTLPSNYYLSIMENNASLSFIIIIIVHILVFCKGFTKHYESVNKIVLFTIFMTIINILFIILGYSIFKAIMISL